MDPMLVMVGGPTVLLLGFAIALGLWHPRSGRQIVGRSLRSDAAEAEIEARDIEQMIDARNERRLRAGRPLLEDELAHQLAPHLRDG